MSEFSIYQPGFYEASGKGADEPGFGRVSAEKWFQAAVALEFNAIAGRYGCKCEVAIHETEIARQFWLRDAGRMQIEGDGIPNHFKQAGFVAYWLRRRMALRNPVAVVGYDSAVAQKRQTAFLQMAPEFCSFIFGYRLCLFAESKVEPGTPPETTELMIKAKSLDFGYLHDACQLMRTKHLSPHAMIMIYRSLFVAGKRAN